jgi:hypothetical protein
LTPLRVQGIALKNFAFDVFVYAIYWHKNSTMPTVLAIHPYGKKPFMRKQTFRNKIYRLMQQIPYKDANTAYNQKLIEN